MNNIIKPAIVLFLVSAICVSALAYVNEITKEPIKKQEKLAIDSAYQEIFPNGTEFKEDEIEAPTDSNITKITGVYASSDNLGNIISVSQKGYGGNINLMVGINTDGSLAAIKVLSHSETPGLGANCEKPEFTNQFAGKRAFPLNVVKSGTAGDDGVMAITSSTITTTAVTAAVNTAYDWFKENIGVPESQSGEPQSEQSVTDEPSIEEQLLLMALMAMFPEGALLGPTDGGNAGIENIVNSFDIFTQEEEYIGSAAFSAVNGTKGELLIIAGFDKDGVLRGAYPLTHSEFADSGESILTDEFASQFMGLTNFPLELGSDIMEIDGYTETSKAYVDAVNFANEWFLNINKGGEN